MKTNYTNILGVRVNSTNYKDALRSIESWIKNNERKYICVSNVHAIMECQKNPKLLEGVNKAAIITADGMPLVWLSKLDGRNIQRVYGPTLLEKISRLSEKEGYEIFFLGGIKGISKTLTKNLKTLFPKLKVVGIIETPNLPLSKVEESKIIKTINSSNAKIVFIGMGCPHQEFWMIENRNRLDANLLIGVGAALDFISGRVRQAPIWVRNIGFEWLFRLSQDPKRLWRRYTITNLLFLFKIINQMILDIRFNFKYFFRSLLLKNRVPD